MSCSQSHSQGQGQQAIPGAILAFVLLHQPFCGPAKCSLCQKTALGCCACSCCRCFHAVLISSTLQKGSFGVAADKHIIGFFHGGRCSLQPTHVPWLAFRFMKPDVIECLRTMRFKLGLRKAFVGDHKSADRLTVYQYPEDDRDHICDR